jgi:flavin-dependent dehydrogenase
MKVVIVGGGTAGWLSACFLAKLNKLCENEGQEPHYDITVVESKDIPIIGAGEGSTGIFADYIASKFSILGVNEIDFLYKTDATLKMGIRFKDWNGIGTEYLSPIQPTTSTLLNVDSDLLGFYLHSDKPHDAAFIGYLMGREYTDFSINKVSSKNGHSFHFDAHKVGEYLKGICLKNGVKYINGEINQLNLDKDTGFLKSVNVKENSDKITADFWIDCSGFARILSKNMGVDWISYEKYLPSNNALPYLHKYDENENILGETLAWCQNNGWMWQIPTQQRYGCGYVYSDMFVNQTEALDELQKTTGRKIEPIRNIKFDAGRVEKFWEKNVVSIGLSSHFLEPIQATSIHATIVQLDILTHHYLYGDIKHMDWKNSEVGYNKHITKMVDDFRDLIQIHYMTQREDTSFWKYCKYELPKTDKVQEILELSKHRSPSFLDFEMYHGSASWGVWSWTLVGLGIVSKEVAEKTLRNFALYEKAKERFDEVNGFNYPLRSLLKHKDFMKALWNKEIGKK